MINPDNSTNGSQQEGGNVEPIMEGEQRSGGAYRKLQDATPHVTDYLSHPSLPP